MTLDQLGQSVAAFFSQFNDPSQHFVFLNPGTRGEYYRMTVEALRYSGQSLLIPRPTGMTSLCPYLPVEALGDDLGAYQAITAFVGGGEFRKIWRSLFIALTILGLLIGSAGLIGLYTKSWARHLGHLILFLMAIYSLYVFDLYSVEFMSAGAILPMLALARKLSRPTSVVSAFILLGILAIGVLGGLAHTFRSGSSLPLLIFAVIALMSQGRRGVSSVTRAIAVAALLIGFALPIAQLRYARVQRDAFLERQPGCAVASGSKTYSGGHAIWHPLLLGLAYLPNPKHGVEWSDYYAFQLAERQGAARGDTGPFGITHRYESFVRGEYLRILRDDPLYIARVYALKAFDILGRVAIFLLPGIIALFSARRRIRGRDLPLAAAIVVLPLAIAALPAMITFPFAIYTLGLYATAAVFSVLGICEVASAPKRVSAIT